MIVRLGMGLGMFVLSFTTAAQTLFIKSQGDGSEVPHAVLRVSFSNNEYHTLSDEQGRAVLTQITDTNAYLIEIRSLGYLPYKGKEKGRHLRKNPTIYLVPDPALVPEVVVTAQYTPNIAEKAIHKITVIDNRKIEQMGAVNLRDVLTNSLNVRISQDNILGSNMSLQGISGENVKILIDGMPIIGRQNGNIDLSQINLQNIERIEIVEGPLSVQYGTNALAGTINLISKQPKSNLSRKISANTQYESVGNYNASLQAVMSMKRSALQFSLARNYFDGWNANDKPFQYVGKALADSNRFQQWKPKEQYLAELNLTHRFQKQVLSFTSSYFNELITNRGKPLKPYEEKAFDDLYKTQRFDNRFHIERHMGRYWHMDAVAAYSYFVRHKNTYFADLTTLDKNLSVNSSDHDTSAFNLAMSRASFSRIKDSTLFHYELGYDVSHETALGARIENKRKEIGDYAVFATCEYTLFKKLTLKPGIRYGYNTQYAAPITPSFNIKADINPKNTARVSYARGFRSPSLKELHFFFVDINHNIIGNRDLQSEQSHSFAASWINKVKLGSAQLQTEVGGFHNTINNLITLAQVSGNQYSYVNIGKYKTQGVQLVFKYHFHNLQTSLASTVVGRYNELNESEEIPAFNYSPEASGSASYTFKYRITVSAFYKYNGKLPSYQLTDNQLTQTFIDPYHLLDLTLQKAVWNDRMTITLGCKNVLNVTNIRAGRSTGVHASSSNSLSVAMGRNYFVKLSFNLSAAK